MSNFLASSNASNINATGGGDVGTVLEIRDPAIDSDEIVRRIRANIAQRIAKAQRLGVDFEKIYRGQPMLPNNSRDQTLQDVLVRLQTARNRSAVGLDLTPNKLPLVGKLVQKVRKALHDVAIFYVNKSAGSQLLFNQASVSAISQLIAATRQHEAELAALRAELDELRVELERSRRPQ
jgi:hypothetical protein